MSINNNNDLNENTVRVCSPSTNDKSFSLTTIDDGSPNSDQLLEVADEQNILVNGCDQLFEIDGSEHENGRDETTVVDGYAGESQGKGYPPPVVGMEFDTYDDAYNYYNSYAKEIGFAIRVKSSWTRRNSKEKRGAVLCCNCEGFKTLKEANSHRKETRTGCLAMIRLRSVESNRWRVDEVKLEHNHSFDPERAQNSKSHKRTDGGSKRKLEPTLDVEVRTIKLYRMPVGDASGYGSPNSNEGGTSTNLNFSRHLKLRKEIMKSFNPCMVNVSTGLLLTPRTRFLLEFLIKKKGHVHQQTSLKEFFEIYELVMEQKRKTEAIDDFKSRDSSPSLRTRYYYELQLSKLYTNAMFRKVQEEIVMMSSCFGITESQTNGSSVTYMVKVRQGEELVQDAGHVEVTYDKTGAEVRCSCCCFNFKGYLCRHALSILDYNGVEEIPCQYVLPRWRKDFKRLYVPHLTSYNVDITNPVQCFDHLYKRAMQVVEEGMISQAHYMVSWQAFKESLNKIRLVSDKIE
ncbi:hypothetical protein Ahy_B04g069749 isoform B [Arachis hypogaea]|uniref:Protein FAR1-RELATED SEQUENCE n=1 Tax=Arachis hypogaea TaxID=3818 RepID=A0A444ZDL2_ARAHY|nr:hypothetical protein Ahy_B04g069749 isoform B [Arachis hypogaea]